MNNAYKLNKMASSIRKMESFLPKSWHPLGYTLVFNNMVKLAGTAGLRVEKLTPREVQVHLNNKRSIRNHIGSLHACSMALAAESATGMILGMNVPDTHLPLIKTMNVDFVRRCQGGVRATATLSEKDYQRIHEEDRGDVKVDVVVEDDSGQEPIKAEMIWAWVSKDRTKKKETS
jgi:acyl-coenzyme A thioesterase PaaI-like protein